MRNPFKKQLNPITDMILEMRNNNLAIGRVIGEVDGDPFVILVGRAHRAAELLDLFESMNVDVKIEVSFDPPQVIN